LLEKLGMSEYAKPFAEKRIDFSVLPDLTDQDLEKWGVLLYQSTGRAVDAHAVLVPVLQGFSPTPKFQEIEQAQRLLDAQRCRRRVQGEGQ